MTPSASGINQRLTKIFEINHGGHSPFLAMEGLRGLAVTLVFLVHFVTLLDPWLPAEGFTWQLAQALRSIGHSGVDLFFLLSGFLIYGTLIAKEKAFLPYMRRRIERLYPTFLAVMAIYISLSFLFPGESKIPGDPLAATIYLIENLLLLPGIFDIAPIITVAWSLSYEMFFYLTVPLVIFAIKLRRWHPTQRIALFVAFAAAIVAINLVHGFHVRLAMFAAGMALWDSLRNPWLKLDRTGLWALAIGLLFIHLLHEANLPGAFRYASLFITFYLLCAACLGQQGLAYRLFCWRPARWLGNMSYSYYLIHGLGLKAGFMLLAHLLPPDHASAHLFWSLLLPMFAATLIVSSVLFVLIERPLSLESRRSSRNPYSFLGRPSPADSR